MRRRPPTGRRFIDYLMSILAGASALAGILALVWILSGVVAKGMGALKLAFFTQLPAPPESREADWPTPSWERCSSLFWPLSWRCPWGCWPGSFWRSSVKIPACPTIAAFPPTSSWACLPSLSGSSCTPWWSCPWGIFPDMPEPWPRGLWAEAALPLEQRGAGRPGGRGPEPGGPLG